MFAKLNSMFKTVRNIGFAVIVLIFVFQMFVYAIQKDKPPTLSNEESILQSSKATLAMLNDPELNKTKEQKQLMNIYRITMCGLIGDACTNNPADSAKNFDSSLFGGISKAIVFPFANPPASGGYFVAQGLREAGFVPKTFAAEGIGYSAMKPMISIWKLFRNIAFTFASLLIVIIGFLIMFRFKINPQTIITAESALPRIVITVMLITFSFAIGGLMIDLMYVFSTVIGNVLAPPDIDVNSLVFKSGFSKLFNKVVMNAESWDIGGYIMNLLPGFVDLIVRLILGAGIPYFILKELPPITVSGANGLLPGLGTFIGAAAFQIGIVLIGIFLPFILSLFLLTICALFLFIRILALLFSAYLRIIFNILFSPLILLTGILPGKNAFSNWIKVLAADLIVFPLVMSLIIISSLIINIKTTDNLWQPPFLYGGLKTNAIKIFLGLGLLFSIPDFVKSVREFMGVKGSPFKLGLGVFLGGLGVAAGGGLGMISQFGGLSHGIKGATEGFGWLKGKATSKKS